MYGPPLPATLPGPALTDREAITDTCYRAFISIDHADLSLLLSAITPDIQAEIIHIPANGAEELKTKIWNHVANNLDTIHHISNMRVSVDSQDSARTTFAVMAVHCKPGKGFEAGCKFTTGATYQSELVKVKGEWRLKMLKSNHVWAEGEGSIMAEH